MTDEPTHAKLNRASRLLSALATVVELSLDSVMERAALAACHDTAIFVEQAVASVLFPDGEALAPIDEPPEPATILTGGQAASVSGAARSPSGDTRQKTPERVELLRELWVQGGPSRETILGKLNALPGAIIPMANLVPYIVHWGIAASSRDELRPARPPTLRDIAARDREVAAPPVVRPSLAVPPTARQTIADLAAAANSKPVKADAATIRAWASQRGITFDRDLAPVNAKRRERQLPPFELEQPRHAG